MFNIITLITITASLMNPIAPTYYQEYDLIGEIPIVEVTASGYANNAGVMPEIIVTAAKVEPQTTSSADISEIVVTASRPSEQEMRYYGMMSEVVVTAEKYPQTNTDVVYTRPNPQIDYSQSSVKHFYLYVMIIVTALFLYTVIRIFIPVLDRPHYAVIGRTSTSRTSQNIIPRAQRKNYK
jgi:hypothetical protein